MQARGLRSERVVAIGDLNGSVAALEKILAGTGVLGRGGRWSGGRSRVVQVGDIFNRGDGARRALELLLDLGRQARAAGGDVTVLLGNHEVMTALGNEAYCTVGEYLSFATAHARAAWPRQVRRAFRRLYRQHPPGGPIAPCRPRLEAWMTDNVPGRTEMRRALGPKGRLGRAIRRLPVALRIGDAVFVHGGLSPYWARRGIDGLNREAAQAWRQAPSFYGDLPRRSLLRAATGPLFLRRYGRDDDAETEAMLDLALDLLEARRMVVGHTQTRTMPGGQAGRIACRFGSRLIGIDVSLGDEPGASRAALVIEGGVGQEWRPEGTRVLWRDPDRRDPR